MTTEKKLFLIRECYTFKTGVKNDLNSACENGVLRVSMSYVHFYASQDTPCDIPCFFTCCYKYFNMSNLKERGFILVYSSKVQSIMVETSRRSLKQLVTSHHSQKAEKAGYVLVLISLCLS